MRKERRGTGVTGPGQRKARLQAMRFDRDPAIVPIWVSRVGHHTTSCTGRQHELPLHSLSLTEQMPSVGWVRSHFIHAVLTAPHLRSSGNQRRTLAVKHSDGEPLSRVDLQYDLLYFLFSNTQAVFTDPYTTIHGKPFGTKVTFRDLYINALIHSPRCSKTTKDKLLDNPAFGDEFGKISLLSNAGRINTTMACTLHIFFFL